MADRSFTSLSPSTNAIIIGGGEYILGSTVAFVIDNVFHFAARGLASPTDPDDLDYVERLALNFGQALAVSFFTYHSIMVMYGEHPTTRDPVSGVPFVLGLVSHQPFFFKNAAQLCTKSKMFIEKLATGQPDLWGEKGDGPGSALPDVKGADFEDQ